MALLLGDLTHGVEESHGRRPILGDPLPTCGATVRGTRYVRHARGYVYGVRSASAALCLRYVRCTYGTQEAGTRTPYAQYGGLGAYASARRPTDHCLVVGESPARDGRQPVMQRLVRVRVRVRVRVSHGAPAQGRVRLSNRDVAQACRGGGALCTPSSWAVGRMWSLTGRGAEARMDRLGHLGPAGQPWSGSAASESGRTALVLGRFENGSLTGRGSRGVSLPQHPPILHASSDSVVEASPTSSLIEFSGSGAGAVDDMCWMQARWAGRRPSRLRCAGRRRSRAALANMHLREEGRQGTFRHDLQHANREVLDRDPPGINTKTTRYATRTGGRPLNQPTASARRSHGWVA